MTFQRLYDSNPAKIWLRERFEISMELANGHHIVTRFHLDECAPGGFQWGADKLSAFMDPGILPYVGNLHVIADVLNERMHSEATKILGHVQMSFSILDALHTQDYQPAYQVAIHLTHRLLPYDPRSSDIWANWIKETIDTLIPLIDQDNA